MAEKENKALECMRQKQWTQAIQIFDQIINNSNKNNQKNIHLLAHRSECNVQLNRYDLVVQDTKKILSLLINHENEFQNIGAVVYKRLIHSLFKLKRYNEAEQSCRDLIKIINNTQHTVNNNGELSKTLERLRTVLQMANGQKNNQRISQQTLEEEMSTLDSKLDSLCLSSSSSNSSSKKTILTKNASGDAITGQQGNVNNKKKDIRKHEINSFQKQIEQVGKGGGGDAITCSYCSLGFNDKAALRAHCSTHEHQTIIMSDEGRDWKWRPPPRGFTSDTYVLCESYETNGNVSSADGVTCRYGAQCVEAHGIEELAEWKERFEYRKMKMQRACEKELYGKSYTEQLLEKWIQAPSPEKVMKEKIDGVEETCSADLITTVSSKVSKREWTFVLKTKRLLKAVALLQDAHRNHYVLKQVFPGEPKINKKGKDGHKVVEAELTSDQEWTAPFSDKVIEINDQGPTLEHRIKVVFSTDIYGTFRQSVVFDLGGEPVLVKHLCVDVVPVTDADKIKEIRKEMILSVSERWDATNTEIIPFSSPVYPGLSTPHGSETCERDRDLLNAYPAPRANNLCLTQSTVTERHLTKNNYRTRMHELLYVEEMARYEQVARYNVTCKLRVAPSYLLAPSGMATSTAKYAHSGELFALLTLGKDVSEDTSAGRLILNNCTTILLASSPAPTTNGKRRVYEALIEDKGKNMIYLRLSAITVRELAMRADSEFSADVQFQLNRVTYCEWHHAIDKISDYKLIFPDTVLDEPTIPWSPYRQWNQMLDSKLNSKQKEAVIAITSPIGTPIPPILIIGPFGTGKTYTLAQAIKQLIHQPDSKILICTHSNSAADLYIKDYLHPWLEAGVAEARPLRVYYHKRWVTTVDQVVQKYCLIEMNNGVRNFRLPTLEDITKHRIVVVTLSISMYLSTLGLPKGYFTHILLDEAAQAMESEALMPLALATPTSRIVLAGDHMQLSPELFSQFAKERNLHISLLERLYEHYPANFPCKILLCENYRAHEAIINFTSELFYDQKLIASGKQPRHEKFYPLTFFTTRGEDVQDQNSTAFYNNSEVYEVVERICELRKRWPPAWGKLDEQSIGIMTPYADQVFRIRSELRKRRMGGISVERVLNVQGKQFRAVFLSTVRTRRTCQAAAELDYGFLSNRKLLNTAITRAQSLVAVVGDPVALCSIGRCRKVWERFIEICNDNKSLFGITWSLLRSQLDGVELKKTYTLNPLAPEFVPRALQQEAYIKFQPGPMVGPPLVQLNIMPPITMPMTQMNNTNIRQQNTTQVQPMINTSNPPPLVPYPLYYFPGGNPQQPPPNPTVFPITCPPPPPGQPPPATQPLPNVPISYPPPVTGPANPNINPWNVNSMPMASPNGRSTPTWALKQAAQKKPNEIVPQMNLANQRILHPNLVQNRAPMIPQHLMNPQNMPPQNLTPQNIAPQNMPPQNMGPMKAQQQFPMAQLPLRPQQRISPDTSPLPTGFVPENFIPNELSTHAFLRNINNPPPERIPYPPSVNKIHEPVRQQQVTGLMNQEKEQIQFLQNVHFPERGAISTQNIRDVQLLLPPHVRLQDICNEDQEVQLQWYHHLLDTQGIESANKFMELILHRTLPQPKPSTQHMPQPPMESFIHINDISRSFDELFSDKVPPTIQPFTNFNIPNGHGPSGITNDHDRPWPMPEPKPTILNQYMSNKPFSREFDSTLLFGNNMYNQNINNQRDDSNKVLQIRNIQNAEPTIDLPWQTNKTTQSVPLYRRQAGQSNPINNSNDGTIVNAHTLLETLEKQNTSSGAFAGYARAFSLQQNEPHMVQHHNISVTDRNMMNGNVNMNVGLMDCRIPLPNNMTQQQRMQQHHLNTEFSRPMNGLPMDHNMESDNTTYASVLRQNTPKLEEDKSDPFGLLREYGQKPQQQQQHGLYNYFD